MVPFLRFFRGSCADFLPIPFPLPVTPPCPQKCTLVDVLQLLNRYHIHICPSPLPRNAPGDSVL